MKKKFKKTCAKVLALTMALSMAFSAAPANSADAKAKKPALSKKKVTITVKKTQKVRIKNTKGIKKTTWSVKNKKIAKLTKKKKTSVVIKGVKKGSTTVTAKVKTKKKTYKLKLKVTVKKALPVPQPTAQVTANPGVIATPAAPDQSTRPLPGQSAAPAPGETTPPSTAPSQTPVPTGTPDPDDTVLAIAVPGERTGIKQGESLQLNATGNGIDQVKWSVSNVTGVSISESGLLTVAADTEAGRTVKVTVTSAVDSTLTDSVSFKIIENQTPVLTENQIQMNQSSEGQPYGLNYRSEDAVSIVSDPERGDVVRFDSSVGYKNDMLAYMLVDPMYAGKKVTISAYIKYDKLPNHDTIGLVLNERWTYKNPAAKWNAEPDTWHYVSGEFTLPADNGNNYTGQSNFLYLSKFIDLAADENAVYYIDDLVFSVEKSEVADVTLSVADDVTELYQNHTLQCSAKVTGTNNPMQKVTYSIEPEVDGVSIDETGLLTVGNVAAGTQINIKATSFEDQAKFDTKAVTVLEQTVDSVSVTAAGRVTKIYSDSTLQFSAEASTTGDPATTITWSIEPEVDGASITQDGLLTVGVLEEGTNITVTATATSESDPAKTAKATYIVTVLGDHVEKHVVKAIQANQWSAFTEDYYNGLVYDEKEGSVYYENASSNLATGSKRSCIGFLVNSDGSTFDASAYNVLKIKLKCDASETATAAKSSKLRVYTESSAGYSDPVTTISESAAYGFSSSGSKERVWKIPLSDLVAKGVSLADIKALALETNSGLAGQGLKVYDFTFEKVSDYEPYDMSVSQEMGTALLKEQKTLPLTATVNGFNGEVIDHVNIDWISSDESIATVSQEGIVTGVSAGEATITATAVGYEEVTASYKLTIYDDTVVSMGIRIGEVCSASDTEEFYFSESDLSPDTNGLSVKAVKLNAGGEVVEEIDPDQITISSSRNITPVVDQGVLTAAMTEEATFGSFYLKVSSDGAESGSFRVYVYKGKGYQIPITKDTVYCASEGKEHGDIVIKNGSTAVIESRADNYDGIGVKCNLPDGQKLSQYSRVVVVTGKTYAVKANNNGCFPVSLYMPAGGWDTDFIACHNENTANTKLASNTEGETDSTLSVNTFTLDLTEQEADTNTIHFSVGYGKISTGEIPIKQIILLE